MAEIVLTEANHGRTVSAQVDDTIVVQLAEIPTTGFRWEIAAMDGSALEVIGDEFRPDPQSGTGGGGTRVLRFRAKGRGATNLELRQARPWESSPPRSVLAVCLNLG